MLEAAEGGLRLPEVMRCVLLYPLEVVDGRLCLLEVMRCAFLRIVECRSESEVRCKRVEGVPD